MPILTDEDLMPFGRFEGQEMVKVPAWYLIVLYEDGNITDKDVLRYIKSNMASLKLEIKNIGIYGIKWR